MRTLLLYYNNQRVFSFFLQCFDIQSDFPQKLSYYFQVEQSKQQNLEVQHLKIFKFFMIIIIRYLVHRERMPAVS